MMTRREREERCILPLKLAVRKPAMQIGVNVIAAQYGHRYKALANNLNPENEERAPTLQQFADILAASAQRGLADPILDSLGELANVIWLPLPNVACTEDPDIMESISQLMDQVARLARHICESLEDEYVDKDELSMLEKDSRTLYALSRVAVQKAKNYGDKPRQAGGVAPCTKRGQ